MSWILGFPSPPPPDPILHGIHRVAHPSCVGAQALGVWVVPGACAPAGPRLGPLTEIQPSHLEQAACLRARRAGGQVDRPEGESWSQESLQVGHQGQPRLPARLSLESENLHAKGPQTPTCPTLSWCPDVLCTGPRLSLELPSLICVVSGHLSLGRPPGPELEATPAILCPSCSRPEPGAAVGPACGLCSPRSSSQAPAACPVHPALSPGHTPVYQCPS